MVRESNTGRDGVKGERDVGLIHCLYLNGLYIHGVNERGWFVE